MESETDSSNFLYSQYRKKQKGEGNPPLGVDRVAGLFCEDPLFEVIASKLTNLAVRVKPFLLPIQQEVLLDLLPFFKDHACRANKSVINELEANAPARMSRRF